MKPKSTFHREIRFQQKLTMFFTFFALVWFFFSFVFKTHQLSTLPWLMNHLTNGIWTCSGHAAQMASSPTTTIQRRRARLHTSFQSRWLHVLARHHTLLYKLRLFPVSQGHALLAENFCLLTQLQGFSTFPPSQAFIIPWGLLLISLPNPSSLPFQK